jgi:hypothetical protein
MINFKSILLVAALVSAVSAQGIENPGVMNFPLNGGQTLTINGGGYESMVVSVTVDSVGACSPLSVNTTQDIHGNYVNKITCKMPDNTGSPTTTGLTVTVSGDVNSPYHFANTVVYHYPSISSVTSSIPCVDGGVITVNGANFGVNSPGIFTYIQLVSGSVGLALNTGSSIHVVSDSVITTTIASSQCSTGAADFYLAWGSVGGYTKVAASVTVGPAPSISSVVGNPISALFGGAITIYGSNFGSTSTANILNFYLHNDNGYYSDWAASTWATGSGGYSMTASIPAYGSQTQQATSHRFDACFKWGTSGTGGSTGSVCSAPSFYFW